MKIGVDATRKDASEGYQREWPPDMIMDDQTRTLVSERWKSYGLEHIEASLRPDSWSGQGAAALRRLLS
jgi:hypothetical protein